MAGHGSRLALDPLQCAFRTLCGGPDGPIAIRLTFFSASAGQRRPTASLTSFAGDGFVGGVRHKGVSMPPL